MSVMEKDKAIDFTASRAHLGERLAPGQARRQRIMERYHTWFQKELARPGASVGGEVPDEVQAALAAVEAQQAQVARQVYDAQRGSIRAELEQQVSHVRESYQALMDAMASLDRFEHEAGAFAASCECQTWPSLVDRTIEPVLFQAWCLRVDGVLHPPTPRPRLKAADNPLVLTDVLS